MGDAVFAILCIVISLASIGSIVTVILNKIDKRK